MVGEKAYFANASLCPAPNPLSTFDGLPEKMTTVFDRNIVFAGISTQDSAGRTVDIHCLRHAFVFG